MSARPRRPERYQTQPTARLPGRPPGRSSGPSRYPNNPRYRRNRGCGGIVLSIFLLLILGLGGVVLYGIRRWQDSTEDVIKKRANLTPVSDEVPDIATQPFNILLVGVDFRSSDPNEGARSDTLILVHVDPQNQQARMLSIPRDSAAYIPRVNIHTKINAAYSYGFQQAEQLYGPGTEPSVGGVTLAAETVAQFLALESHGAKIDYYAAIDFNGFKQIVDAIGGIVLDVPKPLLDPQYPSDDGDNGYIRLYIPAGLQHMDGTTALRYARSRHVDSDFGRSQRQQQVIRAILQAMTERGLIDQIIAGDRILDELKHTIQTDLPIDSLSTVRAMAGLARSLQGNRISSYTMSTETVAYDTIIEGSTIVWNEEAISQLVEEWLRGPATGQQQAEGQGTAPAGPRVQVLNGARVSGLAGEVTQYLSGNGFETLQEGNAGDIYENTLIVDFRDNVEVREQLAQLLGIKEKYMRVQPEAAEAPPNPDNADILLILGLDYREEWRGAGGN